MDKIATYPGLSAGLSAGLPTASARKAPVGLDARSPVRPDLLFGQKASAPQGSGPSRPPRRLGIVGSFLLALATVTAGQVILTQWASRNAPTLLQVKEAVEEEGQDWTQGYYASLAREGVAKDLLRTYSAQDIVQAAKEGRILKAYATVVGGKHLVEAVVRNVQGSDNRLMYTTESDQAMEQLQQDLLTANPNRPVVFEAPSEGSLLGFLLSFAPMLLIMGVWIMMQRRMMGGPAGLLGKQKNFLQVERPKERFSDVKGCDEAVEELREIVAMFSKQDDTSPSLGEKIPRGVLLEGPPGTGKSLLVRATAGEAGVNYMTLSGSDFVELFVGIGARRVRELFETAAKNQPCIIFIDELDALGKARAANKGSIGGHDEREQTLNQLLVEIQAIADNNRNILLMAATNRVDILDPALVRSGRFDYKIQIYPPQTAQARLEILQVHGRKKVLAPDIDLMAVAKQTSGLTGADLENLMDQAARFAKRHRRKAITQEDLQEGIARAMLGLAKKDLGTPEDRRLVAAHEAGHALPVLVGGGKVQVYSTTPRGQSLGHMLPDVGSSEVLRSQAKLLHDILVYMGGRGAEKAVMGEAGVTLGAADDISKTRKLIRMALSNGLLGAGYSAPDYTEADGLGRYPELTPEHQALQGQLMGNAVEVIGKMIDVIGLKNYQRLVDLALERETVYGDDVKAMFEEGFGADFDWTALSKIYGDFIQQNLEGVLNAVETALPTTAPGA